MVTDVQSQTGQAIEIRVECAVDLPHVEADTVRLREVLRHLIENAREAMPHGGTLTLAVDTTTVDRNLKARWAFLSEGSSFVRLRVIDTGCGMPPSIAAHAFEPFFTTKGKGRGAGMGLASVYGIVKQSGGYVFAERTGEQGTCMTLLLPPTLERQSARPPTLRSRDTGNAGVRSRILLVEDDAGVRDLLLDLLQNHGFEVQAAASAEAAQACARDHRFDLLLTDLDLPKMDGARLAAALTAEQSQLQVIVMSGYPDDGTIDAALGRRPAFLRKPFTSDVLLAAIEEALGTTDDLGRRQASGSAARRS
jgi:CheY-like chemotaxis protein